MSNIQAFTTLCNELIVLFEQGIQLENEKLEIIKKNRVSFLDECMKKEQAFILKLRGYDTKRETLQRQLGYENLSFQEILAKCSIEEYTILQPIFSTLTEKVAFFQELSDNAKRLIQLHLHHIQLKMDQETLEASKKTATTHFTDRSI